MIVGTAAIYGISLFYAEKIIDKAFIDNGYNGLKVLFMSKKTYEIELNKVIRNTIDEYQQQNSRTVDGKFPFYHSSILFDKLSEYFLFKTDNPKLVEELFESNPNIFRPTAEELRDFYALFLDKISKNKKLKKLFIDENYKEEIFNQTDKIYQLLNKSDEILEKVSGLERKLDSIALVRINGKFDGAIQIDGYYRNQGLEIYHKLERFSPRKSVVEFVVDLLENNSWVNLFANISMGKSQLAVLISERYNNRFWIELKDIDQQQMIGVVLSELRSYFSPDNLLVEIKDLVNLIPENSIIVLDDLPKLDLAKKDLLSFLELLNCCKSKSIHLLSTSNFNLPGTIKEHYSDFKEFDIPYLVQDEVKEVMAAHGSSDVVQNALSKVILNLSFGHPIIVAAINRFMAESNWNVDQEQLESLFAGDYDTGLETDTYEKLLKTVTDEDARALLYRLKLVLGKISDNEISIVADTLPGIQHPHEKVSKLVGLWIQKLKVGSFELNPLVRKINSSLPSNLARDINVNLGNDILNRRKLNQLEAYRAIWYFLAAGEVNKAGFILSVVLKSAQENPGLYFDWGFDSFWLSTALPSAMDIYLKATIRLFQINLLKAKGDSIEYLMTDAEIIVKEAATQNVNIAPIALQLTMYFSDKDPVKSNHYLTLVLTQLKELNEDVSFDLVDDLPLNTEMLIWNNLLGVKSEDQFKGWFEVLKQLGAEKIKSSLNGNLHFATSFIFSSRLYEEEKIKETPDWAGLLTYFDLIISAAQGVEDLYLLPLAVKYKIKILTVHLNDELAAKKVFEEALSLVDGSEIKEIEFILKDEYGRQLSYLGHKDLALPILLEAAAIDTALVLTDKVYTYLALNEILIESNPSEALVFMEHAIRLQDNNPYINDVESAKIYGEYSIVLWQNNKRIEAIYQVEKALDKVVNSYVPEDGYQATIIRLGHVLNYYHHISNSLPLPKAQGDDYVKPFAGMFYKPHENLLNSGFYFEQRKFMQAFLMLQSFEALKDLEMSKKWAKITYRLFDEESQNPFKKVMMRETAYFILDDDFETAISRGFKLMSSNDDQVIQEAIRELPEIVRNQMGERPKFNFDNADIYLFEYVFLYIVIKILDNYQRSNEKQELLSAVESLSGIKDYFVDPRPVEWIITALEYLADDTKTIDDILGIKHDISDLSNTITLMLYLIASFRVSVREAFKLHLSLIGRLEMVSTQVAGISNYYFIVVPFIIEFWIRTIKNNPKDFENYSFLQEKGLSKVEGEDLDKKLKTLFRVLVHHLNYEPNSDEERWLDS